MIPLAFILLNFLHALWHKHLINQNYLIKSWRKIIEYTALSLLAGLTILILSGGQVVPLILFAVLTRLAWFDLFLNILRGKPLFYQGQISKKKSLTDWFEKQTGIPIAILMIFYIGLFVLYLIIYLL